MIMESYLSLPGPYLRFRFAIVLYVSARLLSFDFADCNFFISLLFDSTLTFPAALRFPLTTTTVCPFIFVTRISPLYKVVEDVTETLFSFQFLLREIDDNLKGLRYFAINSLSSSVKLLFWIILTISSTCRSTFSMRIPFSFKNLCCLSDMFTLFNGIFLLLLYFHY